jgi:hypothetical protein
MAKKKNTKKPVSKRTTRATLEERNERLGNTDAPKPRKPRAQKPKVVVTTEPATETVWREGTVEEFLGETQTVTPPAEEVRPYTHSYIFPPPVEYTKVNKNFIDSAWELINFKLDDVKVYWKKHDPITVITDFSFSHPLIFGVVFSVVVGVVALGAAAAAQYFRW